VIPKIKQLFERLTCDNLQALNDFRFNYFVEKVYPHLLSEITKGVLIFIPSYLDFVRVRNFLRKRRKEAETTFVQCCEYTPGGHVTRARAYFYQGRRDFMLYTERFHFFLIDMIFVELKKIVFYGLPTFPEYYPQLLNLMSDSGTCLVMFSKFDIYKLEPLLGQKRCTKLLSSHKNHHMFY